MKNTEVEKTKKNSQEAKPKKSKKRFNIGFLITILLLVFLLHVIWGVVINSAKLYSLSTKIFALEKIDKAAKHKNTYLREELEKYNSNSGVEALARDRLQFSKEDETLVIIKNTQQENEE